jgi:hypothetical protein
MWFKAGKTAWINREGTYLELQQKTLLENVQSETEKCSKITLIWTL